jgi:4-hydroxy-3-polyprenylbenzoate decarboxylase
MPIQNLSEFVNLLEKRGHLARIDLPVSPHLEITEFTDRVSKMPADKNRALLFQNVVESDIPVLINAFGSPERMAWALNVENLDELNRNLGKVIDLRLPQGFGEMVGRGRDLWSVLKSIGLGPKKVRRAPVQEVILTDEPSLDFIPILQCWPKDGGRFITLPQVITRDPESDTRNVGMYRLQVIDEHTLLVHWQRHKGGAEHERVARQIQKDHIPAAIVLGGDPASMWCASAPLPPNIDEYLLAGYLRGAPVEFVDCVSQPLEVPAQAEIVIEGTIDPNEHLPEGPFGDHTGYSHRAIPCISCNRDYPPEEAHLPHHDCRDSPHGRCLDGQSHRKAVLAINAPVFAGDSRCKYAGRRYFSQPGAGIYQKTISRPCSQGNLRLMGVGFVIFIESNRCPG